MKDINILIQLLKYRYLNELELKRAKGLIHQLNIEYKQRETTI